MIKNKTEWSMRVFVSKERINYPAYILKAIEVDYNNTGDANE